MQGGVDYTMLRLASKSRAMPVRETDKMGDAGRVIPTNGISSFLGAQWREWGGRGYTVCNPRFKLAKNLE